MLVSAALNLVASDDASVPRGLSRAAHAIFLAAVHAHSPTLAAELHDDEQVKPFTVSDLWPVGSAAGHKTQRGVGDRKSIARGQRFQLRFTSLRRDLSQALRGRDIVFPKVVELEGARLEAGQWDDGPLSGSDTYQEMAYRRLFSKGPVDARVVLTFASPTTFRSQGKNVPLPLPGLVFGSLADRWNAFSSVQAHPDLRSFAEECLAVSRYQLRTELVSVGGGRQVGFVGWCEYTALNRDAFWLRQISLLADFAFYSGVGYKTTMGLGQTWRAADGRSLPRRAGVDAS